MDKNGYRDKQDRDYAPRRLSPTRQQKRTMMATLLRKKSAFSMAKDLLRADHFAAQDPGYGIAWAALLQFREHAGRIPRKHELLGEISLVLKGDPEVLDSEGRRQLTKFVNWAYSLDVEELDDRIALRTLQQYLEDQLFFKGQELFQLNEETPEDLSRVLGNLREEAIALKGVQSSGLQSPFPKDWDKTKQLQPTWSTGLNFFDYYLNGGHVPGEAHGVIGPFGTAKTMLAIMLSTEAAKFWRAEWKRQGEKSPLKFSYLFFYEGSMDEMRIRALSYMGNIDKEVLEMPNWEQQLSMPGKLKPYEEQRLRSIEAAGRRIPSEIERLTFCEKLLDVNWRPVDMTGDDEDNPGRGTGLVSEIAAIIRQDQNQLRAQLKCEVGVSSVVVDFVGAAADRYVSANGLSRKDELRHIIETFPLDMITNVAKPFRCPVWLFHQLGTQAQAYGPGIIPKITDSAEAKAFPKYLHHFFVLGGKDKQLDMCVLAMHKGRRVKVKEPMVLKIEGKYCNVIGVDDFILDTHSRRIVSKCDYSTVIPVENETQSKRLARMVAQARAVRE